MQGGVEVSVELVHKHVKTGDLLSHGAGDLDEKQPVVIKLQTICTEQQALSLPKEHLFCLWSRF